MKIIIEIPEKSIDMAKTYLMLSCDTEEEENEISEACDSLKAADEPITLDFDKMNDEFKGQLKQLYMALAMISVGVMRSKE